MRRPCMSVMATTRVSIVPSRTIPSSSRSRGCLVACSSWLLIVSPGRTALDGEGLPGEPVRPPQYVNGAGSGRCGSPQFFGRVLEFALQLGQLGVGAHHLRALETL